MVNSLLVTMYSLLSTLNPLNISIEFIG